MRRNCAMALIALALAVRALVPVGWMPSAATGSVIELCSELGVVQAWVDGDGRLHKEQPSGEAGKHQPCAFAGAATPLDVPHDDGVDLPPSPGAALAHSRATHISVGAGLAAPPPPATGPPVLNRA